MNDFKKALLIVFFIVTGIISIWFTIGVFLKMSGWEPPKDVKRCSKILSKQEVQVSDGNYGDFHIEYFFLYNNEDLIKVSLKEYMKYDKGDSLCYMTKEYINQ